MQSRAVERDAVAARAVAPENEQTVHMPLFDGGVRMDKAPADLAPNEVVDMSALHVVNGRLVVDTGYFNQNVSYVGVAQRTFQAFFTDGSTVDLLITTKAVYQYVSSVNQYQPVPVNAVRLTTAPTAGGSNSFTLNVLTDITIGGVVGIVQIDGTMLVTTVLTHVGSVITTAAPADAGGVANGASVYVSPTLNGDPTIGQVDAIEFAGSAWVVFTNTIDPVMYFNAGVIKAVPGLPSPTTCVALAVFHQSLLLLHTEEAGTHFPARIRQSDAGDPTGWTPGTNGVAAIYDLLDTSDFILSALPLGPWMIAYRQQSIMRGSYIGVLNEIIFWEYMSQEDGVHSQGSVVAVGPAHLVVGLNNIYLYTGGYDLPPVGDGVFEEFLAASGDLNTALRPMIFTIYVQQLREVWVFYPRIGATAPDKMLRFSIRRNAWTTREFADEFIAASLRVSGASETTWTNAVGRWQDVQWQRPWQSQTLALNVGNVLLSPADTATLFVYDYRNVTDAGVVVNWSMTTRQLGDGAMFERWERAVFVGEGVASSVSFSEDEGATWISLPPLTLGVAPAVAAETEWIDTASTRLQLKLAGSDPGFSLRYVDVVSLVESQW